MASSGDVAVINCVENPFDRIHKLYRTANQKIVKNDVTEIKIDPPEVQVTVTAEYEMIGTSMSTYFTLKMHLGLWKKWSMIRSFK